MSEIKLEPDKIYLVRHVRDYKGEAIYAVPELAQSYVRYGTVIGLELFGSDVDASMNEYEIVREIVVPELL